MKITFPWSVITTRRCRKGDRCPDAAQPHTAHLTWVGRWRYTGQRPIFLRFPRLHQIVVVGVALAALYGITRFVNDRSDWFHLVVGVIDVGFAALWWHWGVGEVRRAERLRAQRVET